MTKSYLTELEQFRDDLCVFFWQTLPVFLRFVTAEKYSELRRLPFLTELDVAVSAEA